MDPELEQRLLRMSAEMGLDPYQYTPFDNPALNRDDGNSDPSAGSPGSPDGSDDEGTEWCSCGFCERMPTPHEQVCCRDVPKVVAVNEEGCVTRNEDFDSICCRPAVLRIYYWEIRENRIDVDAPGEEEAHRAYRYAAYRMFTRWIWRRLGRRNRVVLPACVVSRIRRQFPSGNYVGFRYPDL